MHRETHSHDHHSQHHHTHDHSHETQHTEILAMGFAHMKRWGILVGVVALIGWFSTALIFVQETQHVVVTQFGQIIAVYDQDDHRGLKLKLPWPIQQIMTFDRRLQILEIPPLEMLTEDPKNITIQCYVCWKIAAPSDAPPPTQEATRPVVRFLKSVQSLETAGDRIAELVSSALRNEIATISLSDLIYVANSQDLKNSASGVQEITQRIQNSLTDTTIHSSENSSNQLTGAADTLSRMGVEIIDLRLKRFNLPEQNRDAIYGRMRSERQSIVARYTSEGESESRKIRSQADKEAQQILAYADAEAQRIKGQADAKATQIYSEAHSQDPEFYSLLRTLEAYEKLLNDKTTLVISASHAMFRLFNEGLPQISNDQTVDQPALVDPAVSSSALKNKPEYEMDCSSSERLPESSGTRQECPLIQ